VPEPALSADGACLVHAGHYPEVLRPGDGPSASAGMVGGNVRGVTTAGTRPPGAAGWEYRPPHPQHHDHADLPIVLNGRLAYQQRPTRPRQGQCPWERHRSSGSCLRSISEREAERIARDEALRAALHACQAAEADADGSGGLRAQREGDAVNKPEVLAGWLPVDETERDAVSGEGEACCARLPLWGCTRPMNHEGDHVAGGHERVYVRWGAQ
jgi:hypothetical protein